MPVVRSSKDKIDSFSMLFVIVEPINKANTHQVSVHSSWMMMARIYFCQWFITENVEDKRACLPITISFYSSFFLYYLCCFFSLLFVLFDIMLCSVRYEYDWNDVVTYNDRTTSPVRQQLTKNHTIFFVVIVIQTNITLSSDVVKIFVQDA